MRFHTLLLAGVIATACGDATPNPILQPDPLTGTARLRVVHTVPGAGAIDVLVDGRLAIANLGPGEVSAVTWVPDGAQAVSFRPAGATGAGHPTSLGLVAGDTTTILTVDSSTILNPWVLSDSGAAVPHDKSKMRVVHFATGTPNLLAWRTQPDFQTFITVQFPFPYQTASPYLQSDAGDWRVLVATEAYVAGQPVMNDTLALSAAVSVPAGESRTVIVMDGPASGVALVVIAP